MRRIEGRAAIIHGPGYNVFGHWLIDFLPRLYILRRAGFDIATLTFIVPSDLHRFAREFLRLVGIPAAHLVAQDHRAELVQPDELIAPTMLRLRNRFNPLLAVASRFWLNRMELPGTPHTGRRIFVSRSQSHGNRMLRARCGPATRSCSPNAFPCRSRSRYFAARAGSSASMAQACTAPCMRRQVP
jgi:capsular polysaccharide biosynthesis protein